jgi:Uma2 family endonuclease
MSAVSQPRFTFEEYLTREEASTFKNEFYQGEIFAMAGATLEHTTIEGNIFSRLRSSLRGSSCRPHNGNQRIRIPTNGLTTYPDVSITCGEITLDPRDQRAINNPIVVFEVLSESTESYDRGEKFDLYRDLPLFREYILVAQDQPMVERFVLQEDGSWKLTVLKGMEAVLQLQSVDASLTFAEIYEDVSFKRDPRAKPAH